MTTLSNRPRDARQIEYQQARVRHWNAVATEWKAGLVGEVITTDGLHRFTKS